MMASYMLANFHHTSKLDGTSIIMITNKTCCREFRAKRSPRTHTMRLNMIFFIKFNFLWFFFILKKHNKGPRRRPRGIIKQNLWVRKTSSGNGTGNSGFWFSSHFSWNVSSRTHTPTCPRFVVPEIYEMRKLSPKTNFCEASTRLPLDRQRRLHFLVEISFRAFNGHRTSLDNLPTFPGDAWRADVRNVQLKFTINKRK